MRSGGECMGVYPARSVERAMKFQEVILKAMGKQITWIQAAEILGMSDRNMRRYRNRLDKGGYDGLIDPRTRRPSPQASADGRRRASALAISGAILRLQRAALPREVARRAWDHAQLYVGQERVAAGRAGRQGQEAWPPP